MEWRKFAIISTALSKEEHLDIIQEQAVPIRNLLKMPFAGSSPNMAKASWKEQEKEKRQAVVVLSSEHDTDGSLLEMA